MKIFKFVFVLGIIFWGISFAKKVPEKPSEVVKVIRGDLSASISSTGTVMPRNRLEIKPPVAGRVEKVLVEEGQNVYKGQILAWMSSSDRAALLDAARSKGPDVLKYWEQVYQPAPVVAPLNGFIILRAVEPGQSVTTADAILVMADYLIVKAQVDETDLGQIKLNQKVEIFLDAYPSSKIAGRVEHIAYESQVVNNVTIYEVDIIPEEMPSFFRTGMSATVNFLLEEKKDVLFLPSKAVKRKNGNAFVFVKKAESKNPAPVQIKTGLESSDNIEIVSGLEERAEVIIPTAKMVQDLLERNRRRGPMNFFSRQQR